jgi:hypothetical protein
MKSHPCYNYISLIITICFCLFCTGCSGLVKQMQLVHKPDNSHWVKKVYPGESWTKEAFQFSDNDVSLTIPSSFKTDSCPVSFGPPLFPIIPLIWAWPFISFKDRGYLYFSFIIENSGDAFTIDTKGIKLIKSDGKIVSSGDATFCTADDNMFACHLRTPGCQSGVASHLLINRGDKILFFVHFASIDSLNVLRIEFDKTFVNGKVLNLPPLALRGDYKLIYYPIVITGHEASFNE